MGTGEPGDEIIQKLLRGLVDPVKVLHDQDKRLVLALPEKQGPYRLEGPFPSTLRVQP